MTFRSCRHWSIGCRSIKASASILRPQTSAPCVRELVGIGLGLEPRQAWYIPFNGKIGKDRCSKYSETLFGKSKRSVFTATISNMISMFCSTKELPLPIFLLTQFSLPIFSTPTADSTGLDHLSLESFGKVKTSIQELIGKGKNQISMMEVPLDKICAYCCEDVDYTVRLKELFAPQLEERGLQQPLLRSRTSPSPLLGRMERQGIFVDTAILKGLSVEIAQGNRNP